MRSPRVSLTWRVNLLPLQIQQKTEKSKEKNKISADAASHETRRDRVVDDDDGDRMAIEIYEQVYGATSLNISALTP